MKKLFFVVIALIICLPTVYARKKKDKAGKVSDHVYLDKKYNFKLTLSKDWKYKIRPNADNYRLVLVQKNYEIPAEYLDAEECTQVPRVVVWVDTTSLSPSAFVDSLISDSYESEQKKDVYKEFDILNESSAGSGTYRDDMVQKGRRTFELAGEKAFRWKGSAAYMKEVSLSASSGDGKRVRGGYSGTIVSVRKGNLILLFHLICERDFYDQVDDEVMGIIKSLVWIESEDKGK